MARPISWQLATVTAIREETPTVRSFGLGVPDWGGHRPGQHVDLRLTAEDGYSVERSYSIASEPERAGEIEITVERIVDGEVSPFLDDFVVVGDRIELRGPIGGYFIWESPLAGRCSWSPAGPVSCRSWPCCAIEHDPDRTSGRDCCSARAISRRSSIARNSTVWRRTPMGSRCSTR